jgi:hypothetical protein
MRRSARGNVVRLRGAMRRLLVRVQRLILIHGDSACQPSSTVAPACAICALARFGLDERPETTLLPRDLGVSLERASRDTASGAALAVCRNLPSVVAQTVRSHELLLDAGAIRDCAGSVHALRHAIRRSARVRGLDL